MTNSLNNQKAQYGLMDVCKFIMAVLVITIHKRIGSNDNFWLFEEVFVIARLAVPFFFASSSFLFFRKPNVTKDVQTLKKYVKKLLKLYLIWFLIYSPQFFWREYHTLNKTLGASILTLLQNFFYKYPGHLWFLPALAISVAALYFIIRKSKKAALIIALVTFVSSIVLAGFGFFEKNFSIFINALFTGFPYVYLGYYISQHGVKLKKKQLIILLIISIISALIEGAIEFFYLKSCVFWISRVSYLPAIYALLCLCVTVKTKNRKIYLVLRKLSMFIYFVHMIVYQEALYIIFYVLGVEHWSSSRLAKLAFTIFYTGAASALLLFLENKKGFRWLKNLYN